MGGLARWRGPLCPLTNHWQDCMKTLHPVEDIGLQVASWLLKMYGGTAQWVEDDEAQFVVKAAWGN